MRNLLIVGAGGHAKAVAEAALISKKYNVVGFLDDKYVDDVRYKILGCVKDVQNFRNIFDEIFVAIGDNDFRYKLIMDLTINGYELATVIHPTSSVSEDAVIGMGSVIMAGAIINGYAKIGRGVVINSGVVVDHDAVVGDCARLGTLSGMAGGASLGSRSWLKAGKVLGIGQKVGDDLVI